LNPSKQPNKNQKLHRKETKPLEKLSDTYEDETVDDVKISSNPFGSHSKLKMDVGYKKFLRSSRKALKIWFNGWCPIQESTRYKWTKKANKNELWYAEAEKFLLTEVAPIVTANTPSKGRRGQVIFSEEEIWATAFLI